MGLATAPLATLKLDERDRRRFRMRRLGWRGDGRTAGVASESLLAEDPERSTLHLPARERERDLDAAVRVEAGISVNSWTHLALVYGSEMSLYINGAKITTYLKNHKDFGQF